MFKDKEGKVLSSGEAFCKITKRFSSCFLDLELMLLRWVGHIPLHSVRNFFYRLSGINLGKKSRIHMWANFFQPRNIKIGEGTIVGDHAFLDGRAPLVIGKHTDIASSVMIYNSEHDIQADDFSAIEDRVEVGDYVFVGPRAIILPGVKIGKGAVVAAGAVVTEDVPDFAVVGGVPAKIVSQRKNKDPRYRLGRARLFQ